MSSSMSLIRTAPQSVQNASVTPASKPTAVQPGKSSPSALFSTGLPKFELTPRQQQTHVSSPNSSTPIARSSRPLQSASPNPSTPGKWQHPRLDEVVKRQERTRFDRDNVAVIVRNGLAICLSFAISWVIGEYIMSWPKPSSIEAWPAWTFWTSLYAVFWSSRLLLLANVGTAVAPLFRVPDTCEDIPLDPSQRKTLGLPPMSRPATPQEKEQWVTPPRFSRNNTPVSATSSLHVNASGSPIGSQSSTLLDNSVNPPMSPFSLSSFGSSHLRDGDVRRRLSYTSNRSSPLSISEFEAAGSAGTPTKNNRSSVGLNNKWLYEKGWGSPRSSTVMT